MSKGRKKQKAGLAHLWAPSEKSQGLPLKNLSKRKKIYHIKEPYTHKELFCRLAGAHMLVHKRNIVSLRGSRITPRDGELVAEFPFNR